MNSKKLIQKIFCGNGFTYGPQLSNSEISIIREFICESIKSGNNTNLDNFEELERYHLTSLSKKIHSSLSKKKRLFNLKQYKKIRSFQLFNWLEDKFGSIEITNEELNKNEEIYWRIVRPNSENDVGPVHADSWFWQTGIGTVSRDKVRIKIWIQIAGTEPGLIFYPNSHHLEFDYETKTVNGKNKPVFDINSYSIPSEFVANIIGMPLIFNDRLLHGGYISKNDTRGSIEFTMLVDRKMILNAISNTL
jgi:hypothetical protein